MQSNYFSTSDQECYGVVLHYAGDVSVGASGAGFQSELYGNKVIFPFGEFL